MINKEYARDLILDLFVEGCSIGMIADMLELPTEFILKILAEEN